MIDPYFPAYSILYSLPIVILCWPIDNVFSRRTERKYLDGFFFYRRCSLLYVLKKTLYLCVCHRVCPTAIFRNYMYLYIYICI